MFFVVRKGEGLENYHAKFHRQHEAREYAESLKATYRHNYDVVKVETVWTTQTLEEAVSK